MFWDSSTNPTAACTSEKSMVWQSTTNMDKENTNKNTAADSESEDGDLEKYRKENEELKQIYRDQKERIRQLKVSLFLDHDPNLTIFSVISCD